MLVQVEDAAVVPLTVRMVGTESEPVLDVTFFDTTGETSDARYHLISQQEAVGIYRLVAE